MALICPSCQTSNDDDAITCVSCGESPSLVPRPRAVLPVDSLSGAERTQNIPADVQANSGSMIGGRYRVEAVLGRGGMGIVYRSHDTELGEKVAIKLIAPELLEDPREIDRLKREIITARRVSHPNVIRIHEFGMSGRDGFVSMEVLPGGTLADRIKAGPIPVLDALRIGAGIAEGLAAAHEAGVIHRDLKPHNVLFDAGGRPKLGDFGLARLASSTSRTVGITGTPVYMSPEMAETGTVDERSDLYSLGVVLYEMLVGRPPFAADTIVRLAMMHARDPVPPMDLHRAGIPAGVESLVRKMLEKEPTRRPASARQVADALRRLSSGGDSESERVSAGDTVRIREVGRGAARSRAPSWQIPAAIGGVVAAAAIGLFATQRLAAPRRAMPPRAAAVRPVDTAPTVAATPRPVDAGSKVALAARPVPMAAAPEAPKAVAGPVGAAPAPTRAPAPKVVAPPARTPSPPPAPTPAPAQVKLTVLGVNNWVQVWIDGTQVAEQTPLRGHSVTAGRHQVRFVNPVTKFDKVTTIDVDRDLVLKVDPSSGTVTQAR